MTCMNNSRRVQHFGGRMTAEDMDNINKQTKRPVHFVAWILIAPKDYILPYGDDASPPDHPVVEPAEHVNEFKFNDRDTREMLCRLVGLKEIPKLDSNAFKKLPGIIGDQIGDQTVVVDVVRTMRDM